MNENSIKIQDNKPKITNEIKKIAKMNPNGWVYKIDARYEKHYSGRIPVEGIMGWWKVDNSGIIDGDFVANIKYKPFNAKK